MLRVGLTGGLGSGKSTVAQMMEARGAHLLQADALAHELMAPGQPVYDAVVQRFGQAIVNPQDGTIDRAKLGAIAFGGGRIAELNAIVHPAVITRQEQWMEEVGGQNPHAIAVVEAALLVEAGVHQHFDKLVVVTAAEEQKIERFTARTGNTRAEAARRIAAQLLDAEKIKLADYVIDNSSSLAATEAQVERLMRDLKSLAARPAGAAK